MSRNNRSDHPGLDVRVWRGNVNSGDWQNFSVPAQDNQTILDVVSWIQRHLDPDLSYRFACRVGMCGSCAMMVNGEPRWTCRTHVKKVIKNNQLEIGPLRNLPVIKDLACDMSEFFAKWKNAKAEFEPGKTRDDPIELIDPESKQRKLASAGIECISCAVCYAACDSVSWNSDYFGPAALNRAWTLINDERDQGGRERLRAISDSGGCANCHAHQSCATYCPNELNPTASIAGLKLAVARAVLKGEI